MKKVINFPSLRLFPDEIICARWRFLWRVPCGSLLRGKYDMSFGKQKFTKKLYWKYLKGAGIFACIAHTISSHIGELVICSGPSMHPTIQDGVDKGNIHRGDIVGCLSPSGSHQLLCKRIVAKEGDAVASEFLPNDRIPRGHVFLLGDNTLASTDSRHFGPVPEGLVQIRLFLRVWPISRFGWISTHWFWEPE